MPGLGSILGRAGRFAGRAARGAGRAGRYASRMGGRRATGTALELWSPRHAWEFGPEWFHSNASVLGGQARRAAGAGGYSGFYGARASWGAGGFRGSTSTAFAQPFVRRTSAGALPRAGGTGRRPWSRRKKLMVGGAGVLGAAMIYNHRRDNNRNNGMQYYY